MYESLLRELAKKRAKYSQSMQPPCEEGKIEQLEREALAKLSTALPDEYIEFLKITNGLDWNGLLIYACETTPISGYTDRFIPGFLETNLRTRKECEPCRDFLFFGDSGIDAYAYKISSSEYQILDRSSMELTETFSSFDDLISEALRIHL